MEKKNAPIIIAKIVVLLLCVLYVISAVGRILDTQSVKLIIAIIVTCLTVYYMFVGYKTPHGNLLRYLFIIVALEALFVFWHTFTRLEKPFEVYELFLLLEIAIVFYVAGRLNKYKENIVLLSIAFVMVVIPCFHGITVFNSTSLISSIALFDKAIILLALIVSYIARYKEHKEAGLTDK